MKAIFNGEILDWGEIRLFPQNRGFRYGDGFFETIAIINGAPRFLDRHLTRLKEAAELLKFNVGSILSFDKILDEINTLQTTNHLQHDAKLKLIVWRNSEGLYTPADGNAHYLITIEDSIYNKINLIKNAGISDKIINYPSPVSRFKTMSALKYVIAGIEKNDRHLDEIIILDHRGFVSESLSSNLFWKKNEAYFTSPLSTGCIEGIMRNGLMNEMKRKGFFVEEKLVKTVEFLGSDNIFTTNALGISHIQSIGQKTFEIDLVFQEIIESIS